MLPTGKLNCWNFSIFLIIPRFCSILAICHRKPKLTNSQLWLVTFHPWAWDFRFYLTMMWLKASPVQDITRAVTQNIRLIYARNKMWRRKNLKVVRGFIHKATLLPHLGNVTFTTMTKGYWLMLSQNRHSVYCAASKDWNSVPVSGNVLQLQYGINQLKAAINK